MPTIRAISGAVYPLRPHSSIIILCRARTDSRLLRAREGTGFRSQFISLTESRCGRCGSATPSTEPTDQPSQRLHERPEPFYVVCFKRSGEGGEFPATRHGFQGTTS